MQKIPRRTNRHHRLSRARGGSNHPSNISIVDEKQHQSFHCLFQDSTNQGICDALNNTWGDPSVFFFVVEKSTVRGVKKLLNQLTA